MCPRRHTWLIAASLLFGAPAPALAQDPSAPPGQTQADPPPGLDEAASRPPVRTVADDVPRNPRENAIAPADEDRDADLEKARAAARSEDRDPAKDRAPSKDDDLDRARNAARSADPRLLGLERAREAARAADHSGGKDCLSAREARGAIMAKRAVTLAQAVRAARNAWDGEVIDYRLCTFDGTLAYDLTLLNTEGKVARVRVDAGGKLLGVR